MHWMNHPGGRVARRQERPCVPGRLGSAAASRGPDRRGDARRLAQPATVPQPAIPTPSTRRIGLVHRFIAHTNEYPVVVDAGHRRGVLRRPPRHQGPPRSPRSAAIRTACGCSAPTSADPDYGWDRVCEATIRHAPGAGLLRLEHRHPCPGQRARPREAAVHQAGAAGLLRPRR